MTGAAPAIPAGVRAIRARVGAERWAALRFAAIVLVGSRVAIWLAALFADAVAVQSRALVAMHPDPGLDRPFGALVGIWGRWDADWYRLIADQGYGAAENTAAFFPLYPLSMRATGWVVGGTLAGGVVVSLLASLASFYLLHRLVTAELGEATARRAVLYTAVCPTALFLSAVYGEALFLAVTLAAFWAARRGNMWAAGAWGALAALTRPAGLLLLVPLAIMYVAKRGGLRRAIAPEALSLALVPAGTAAFAGWLWWRFDDPLRFVGAQDLWDRSLVTPFQGLYDAVRAGVAGLRQLATGPGPPVYWDRSTDDPIRTGAYNVELLGTLVLLGLGVWLCFRLLPRAYGAYALVSVLLPLSTPGHVIPLMSLPRFALVIFPIFIALAAWGLRRPAVHTAVLVSFPLLLGVFLVQWVTWHFVS